MTLTEELKKELLKAQRNEITEYHVYTRIAKTLPDEASWTIAGSRPFPLEKSNSIIINKPFYK